MTTPGERTKLSVVTPAFNESGNITALWQALRDEESLNDVDLEVVIVDDHSSDDTFAEISEISRQDDRVRGLRMSRNLGSHRALLCGFDSVSGDCVVALAADLQDPPEVIAEMLAEWAKGSQVVWAVRDSSDGGSAIGLSSRLYYWSMRWIFGFKEMPGTGADFFLLDRRVIDAVKEYRESNASVVGLLMWMGFRQSRVYYAKRKRVRGQSGWTWRKKVKMLIDSIASFSYLPVRVMSLTGVVVSIVGFLYAFVVVVNAVLGRPNQGWSSLMVVLLIIGGLQMLMLGVLGEYLWRALDESRRRPLYMIEADTNDLNEVTKAIL